MQSLLTAAQQEERKYRIGSSEVPIILRLKEGISDLWAEKTGRTQRTFGGNRFTEWGNRLEDAVAQKYWDLLLATLPHAVVAKSGTVVHQIHGWAQATPDRLVLPTGWNHAFLSEEPSWGLEIKVTGDNRDGSWGPDGSTQVPDWVEAQVRWQMFVMGLERWDVAVLIGGNDFRWYTLARDPKKEQEIFDQVRSFWFDHVKADEPPYPYTPPLPWVDMAAPPDTVTTLRPATPDEALLLSELAGIRAEITCLETKKEVLEATLKRRIGHDLGVESEALRAKFAPVKGRTTVDWKAVARKLQPAVAPHFYAEAVDEATKIGRPYRRFTLHVANPGDIEEVGDASDD